jgi:nitrite reductase/ring-hydroxylating ferredoxin subunit
VRVDAGSLDELREKGLLKSKAGSQPVCVFWHEGCAYALDDRCPHLGFPLHRGTVESGLVTCHWHHARFDLATGGTLDPFADDVRSYPVEIDGDRVTVVVEPHLPDPSYLLRRMVEGLEEGITLVLAKSVLALLDSGTASSDIVRAAADFGIRFREEGFGSGLTVLAAMANVLEALDPADRPLALVHGLAFLSNDTLGHRPRFPLTPLEACADPARTAGWYRRFVETRSNDAAERSLATLVTSGASLEELCRVMSVAATDHVYLDEGHTLDFTNKAFELVDHVGPEQASGVLTSLVRQTTRAFRHEEEAAWRHPYDLALLLRGAASALPARLAAVAGRRDGIGDEAVRALADSLHHAEEPKLVVDAIDDAIDAGAGDEELGRAVAFAASLRIVRFHTSSDHGDWDVVHHGFTHANALYCCPRRAPSPELLRGVYHAALKVFLDRFLNVPAARLPEAAGLSGTDLSALGACFDTEGRVDEAAGIVFSYLRGGGAAADVVAVLGQALCAEDAGFHWFQTYEAAVRQSATWPDGSVEQALVLVGATRFLAAHTPTRRELSQVVRIAARLRRGEALYEEDQPA